MATEDPAGERGFLARFGTLERLGVLAGAVFAIITLIVFFFPGVKPAEPPTERRADIDQVVVNPRVIPLECHLELPLCSPDPPDVTPPPGVPADRLGMAGVVARARVAVIGFARGRLVLSGELVRAEGCADADPAFVDRIGGSHPVPVTPQVDAETVVLSIWLDIQGIFPGCYSAELSLRPSGSETILATGRSGPFAVHDIDWEYQQWPEGTPPTPMPMPT